jgi:hypothetical protein
LPELARFQIYTHRIASEERALIDRVLEHFADAQSLIEMLWSGERELPVIYDLVNTDELGRTAQPPAPEITITGLKLADNWFSHTWRFRSVISIADWTEAFIESASTPSSAPDAYLLQELTNAILIASVGLPENELAHHETSGCLADMCVDKPDMAIKLRCGFLCTRCRDTASTSGISGVHLDAIQNLLDRARLLALGRTPQRRLPPPTETRDDAFLQSAEAPADFRTPPLLSNALRTRSLTVVVGSGLSLQRDVEIEYANDYGWSSLPSWAEIPDRLARRLEAYRGITLAPRPSGTLNEFLIELDSFRERLGIHQFYPRAIFDIFLPRIRATGLANRLVFRLPVDWILTTNYDFLLNYAAPSGTPTFTWKESRQALEYFERARGPAALLKVHGCASRANTVILTSREYDELARNDEYGALTRRVFDTQVALFLGFGFNDPLDLDLALCTANLTGAAQGEKFALIQEGQARSVRERFPNVQVIAYREHTDVASILAAWVRLAAA